MAVAKGVFAGVVCCAAAVAGLAAVAAAKGYGLRFCTGDRFGRHALWCLAAVCCAAMLCVLASAQCTLMAVFHDPVAGIAAGAADAGAKGMWGRLEVQVTAPPQASVRRGFMCSVPAMTRGVMAGGVSEGSAVPVTLWTGAQGCMAGPGAFYRIAGTITAPQWGHDAAWVEVEGAQDGQAVDGQVVSQSGRHGAAMDMQGDAWMMVRAPNAVRRAVARMQDAFLRATQRLSDQGSVLVPGLTLGVMGQRSGVNALAGQQAVDAVYAAGLTDRFRNAGIMHLMAVSGGHFVLAAALVSAVLRRCLASRRVTALAMLMAYAALVMVLYPSDSVTRAAMMGCMGSACLALGRRAQAWSALSWTVLLSVMFRPGVAVSYGFALSVTSVAGIVAFVPALARIARRLLPRAIADPCAVTVAAQALSLPVQVSMGAGVPLCSVLANAIVAPFVGMATVCGLASFAVSWCAPSTGFALAWLASAGTAVMERCAVWLGDSDGVLAWPGGLTGGFVAASCEVIAVAMVMAARDTVRMVHMRRYGAEGARPVGAGMMLRQNMRQWWCDTRRDVLDARWDEPRGGWHGGV